LGSASWRRCRRSDAGKPFQCLDDTRAIAQAVQERYAFGEMLQREVVTSLIAFCPRDLVQSLSHFERRSELAGHRECLLVHSRAAAHWPCLWSAIAR
jgi:hypothetical protein